MRCCAKCKTPYGCGHPFCRCHPLEISLVQRIQEQAAESAVALEESRRLVEARS